MSLGCHKNSLWLIWVGAGYTLHPPRVSHQLNLCFQWNIPWLKKNKQSIISKAPSQYTWMIEGLGHSSGVGVNCVCGVFASPGMALSVLVVLLLTVFYEVLKVWRLWLGSCSKLAHPQWRYSTPPSFSGDSTAALEHSPSESSLTPMEPHLPAVNTRNRSGSFWNTTLA